MKLLKLLLIVVFFVGFVKANAQEPAKIADKNYRPQTVEEREKKAKTVNGEFMANRPKVQAISHKQPMAFTPNNYPIDARAYKYYTKSEVERMTVKEKKEVNYILNDSYQIIKTQNVGCPSLDKNKLNIIDYSFYRKENEKSEIIIDEKCNYKIILFSTNEILEANNLITE
jgi:hypothetical protein